MTSTTARFMMVVLIGTFAISAGGAPTGAVDAPGITGRVTFESTGVVGAEIEVLSGGAVAGRATTTTGGIYELAVPTSGMFDVLITPPAALGVMAQTIRGVVVPAAPLVATIDVALRRPLGTVQVQLVDSSAAALSGLQVRLVTTTGPRSVVDLGVSDATGRVEYRAPVDVDYELRIDAVTGSPASIPADFKFRVDQPVRATTVATPIVLTIPTAVLDVTTTRDGPVGAGNVRVFATGSPSEIALDGGFTGSGEFATAGTTAADGKVALSVIADGGASASVRAIPRDRLLVAANTSTTIVASPATLTIALADAPSVPLLITLLDGGGAPVPDAVVTAATSDTTDALGAASVEVLTASVSTVRVAATDTATLDLPDQLEFTRTVLPVVSPANLRPTLANLTVIVQDTAGTAIVGALVTVSSPTLPAGDGWNVRSTANARTTGATGDAVFRLVPGAGYVVTVTGGSNQVATDSVTLDAGGTSTTLQLSSPPVVGGSLATLSGRIVTPAGDGIKGLSVRSTIGGTPATTNADGAFSIGVSALGDHGLRISGQRLLTANGRDAQIPDEIDAQTATVVTVSASGAIALGNVVLPIDQLELQVTDDAGSGLFNLVAKSPPVWTRTTATVDGTSVTLSARSGYVDEGVRLDRFGEGTMFLFPGPHQITVDEDSLTNFDDIDWPVTESATLTSGPDTLLLVLTRQFGSPITTLTGSPLVSSTATTLTLQLPDAVVTPIVELPQPLLGATTRTQIIVTNRFRCPEGGPPIVSDPADCSDGVLDLELSDGVIPPELGPGPYPIAVRSFVLGSVFVQGGYQRLTLVLNAPLDAPPVLSGLDAGAPAPEGSMALLTATASDAEGAVVVAWDLNGDGVGDVEGASVWVDVPDGPSSTAVGTIVTDTAGRSVRGAVNLVSVNVAPTATLTVGAPDASGNVAVAVTDLDDPASADVPTLVVDLDLDLDGIESFDTRGTTATIDASPLADGTYPVRARVTDKNNGVTLLAGSFVIETPLVEEPTPPADTPATPDTPAAPTAPTPPIGATPAVTPPTMATPVAPAATPAPPLPPLPPLPPIDPLGTRLPETGGSVMGLLVIAFGMLALGVAFAASTRPSSKGVKCLPRGSNPEPMD